MALSPVAKKAFGRVGAAAPWKISSAGGPPTEEKTAFGSKRVRSPAGVAEPGGAEGDVGRCDAPQPEGRRNAGRRAKKRQSLMPGLVRPQPDAGETSGETPDDEGACEGAESASGEDLKGADGDLRRGPTRIRPDRRRLG